MLCADLVNVEWVDKDGRTHRAVANLEDIALSGACLQMDRPLPLNTPLRIALPKGPLHGVIRYCVFREIGYFLGIQFTPGSRWSRRQFRPRHLFDPRRLVGMPEARLRFQAV